MKTLGLIGGIGWESTLHYYKIINEDVRHRLGSLHSAKLILHNLDFEKINALVEGRDWDAAGAALADSAQKLEAMGAEAVLVCSNLMHYIAPAITQAITIPLLHVDDAILDGMRAAKSAAHIGLLGTRFTLEHGFLFSRVTPHPRWGRPRLYTPSEADARLLDEIIYGELCRGLIREHSRAELRRMIHELRASGAQAVVLASSELAALLEATDFGQTRLFDSTELHARYAVRWALEERTPSIDRTRVTLTAEPGAPGIKRSRL